MKRSWGVIARVESDGARPPLRMNAPLGQATRQPLRMPNLVAGECVTRHLRGRLASVLLGLLNLFSDLTVDPLIVVGDTLSACIVLAHGINDASAARVGVGDPGLGLTVQFHVLALLAIHSVPVLVEIRLVDPHAPHGLAWSSLDLIRCPSRGAFVEPYLRLGLLVQ